MGVVLGGVMTVVVVFIVLFIGSLTLLWATKITGIDGYTLGKAFLVIIFTTIASLLLQVMFGHETTLFAVCNFIAGAAILGSVFKAGFGKALLTSFIWDVFLILVLGGIWLLVAMLGAAASPSI